MWAPRPAAARPARPRMARRADGGHQLVGRRLTRVAMRSPPPPGAPAAARVPGGQPVIDQRPGFGQSGSGKGRRPHGGPSRTSTGPGAQGTRPALVSRPTITSAVVSRIRVSAPSHDWRSCCERNVVRIGKERWISSNSAVQTSHSLRYVSQSNGSGPVSWRTKKAAAVGGEPARASSSVILVSRWE